MQNSFAFYITYDKKFNQVILALKLFAESNIIGSVQSYG